MSQIKIGQIGVGHEHASGIMRSLRGLPEVFEMVGVVEEPDPGWFDQKAYDGVPRMTEEELFAVPGLQAVAVETNMPLLAETAIRCMEHGFHLHVDKPGGESFAPFQQLIEGCRAKGLGIQLGYMYRNNPAIQFCLKALRDGWLGDPFELHLVMSRWDGDPYRSFLAGYPGGAMYNFGSHLVDLAMAFLGRPDNVHSFQKQTRDDGLCDNGLAVLEYPRCTATIRAAITEVDGMKHRHLILCGTKGTVELYPLEYQGAQFASEPLRVRMTLLEDVSGYAKGTHVVDCGPLGDRYDTQLLELAAVIRGELENPFSYDHELLTEEVLLAAAGYEAWGQSR